MGLGSCHHKTGHSTDDCPSHRGGCFRAEKLPCTRSFIKVVISSTSSQRWVVHRQHARCSGDSCSATHAHGGTGIHALATPHSRFHHRVAGRVSPPPHSHDARQRNRGTNRQVSGHCQGTCATQCAGDGNDSALGKHTDCCDESCCFVHPFRLWNGNTPAKPKNNLVPSPP